MCYLLCACYLQTASCSTSNASGCVLHICSYHLQAFVGIFMEELFGRPWPRKKSVRSLIAVRGQVMLRHLPAGVRQSEKDRCAVHFRYDRRAKSSRQLISTPRHRVLAVSGDHLVLLSQTCEHKRFAGDIQHAKDL